jgi:hypothetical protein
VIDLNEVLHQIETSETTETNEATETNETAETGETAETNETTEISTIESEDSEREMDASKEGRVDQPLLDEMETEDQSSSSLSSNDELEEECSDELDMPQDLAAAVAGLKGSSKRSKGKAKMDTGLVGFKDDIPDEEFQKMIAGELDPWESDGERVKSHDDDDDIKKHGSEENSLESHDIKAESHDRGYSGSGLIALILAPTRELAIQVHDHLTAVARRTDIKVFICMYYVAGIYLEDGNTALKLISAA